MRTSTKIFLFTGLVASFQLSANSIGWNTSCESKNNCYMSQQIQIAKNGKTLTLGGATIFKSANNLVLRLRVSPKAKPELGIGIKVDDNKPLHLPFTACDKKICEANIAIDEVLLNELKTGKTLAVAYFNAMKKQTTLPVSLTNFNQNYSKLIM